ncbi:MULTISPECIES: TetR/AcrR family transcriptional regulator [unclassified Arthrobacter]|uniref:TetR/AcrR family transcriptional regulator n=1 Tax=unclassified Arthrobacter TaxID=235627 RepID=UPI0024DF69EC|nr:MULTISPECIES: TetR/AcrR family transcriptional regulator [unclassified Arthrobacter]MCC9145465.1 TetR/AcrR family transcriptional regulator [Arthrobacter sp. zg-Y919]MDK1276693.1 TetR/AcrR family transcriptional regulator [Arthrobacter sp. zg.Y919]MDM7989333.1 TetR/AcrR family transcriptional regulator [Arthrobacter sp. zg-Y877]WIB04361.1 TetR/AcrR family transcriptional regulator [Arthrobacter sp. zg-Y919]
MPRITAPTVAEHRAAQQRALLDAARTLLARTGEAPSMADVAALAGLARPSAYQYYKSRQDLLHALVLDVFPRWTQRVREAMDAEPEPADRIMAYVLTNIRLVAEGEHAVGNALAAVAPGEELDNQSAMMHRQLLTPLVETLTAMGVPDPLVTAELINAIVHSSTRLLESGTGPEMVEDRVRELLGPYVRENRTLTAPEDSP